MEKNGLTDNCKKALKFLQENDKVWVGADLGKEIGINPGIHPIMNSLFKRGLVEKGTTTRDFTPKGASEPVAKQYVTYVLTDAGRSYVID